MQHNPYTRDTVKWLKGEYTEESQTNPERERKERNQEYINKQYEKADVVETWINGRVYRWSRNG